MVPAANASSRTHVRWFLLRTSPSQSLLRQARWASPACFAGVAYLVVSHNTLLEGRGGLGLVKHFVKKQKLHDNIFQQYRQPNAFLNRDCKAKSVENAKNGVIVQLLVTLREFDENEWNFSGRCPRNLGICVQKIKKFRALVPEL